METLNLKGVLEHELPGINRHINISRYVPQPVPQPRYVPQPISRYVPQPRTFGEVVSSKFIKEANIEKEKVYRVERRLGIPGKIRRVLVKIDKLEQADYSNQMVRNELKALRAQVQSIVDELDSKKDIELFLSSLPSMYRDVQLSEPREPIAIYETVPAILPKLYSDYHSDGTLTEFANEVHQHLQLTHKK